MHVTLTITSRPQVGTLIANDAPLLIVNSVGKESEALQRLSRIGYTSNVRVRIEQYYLAWWALTLYRIGQGHTMNV